jgi:hypothetical protein
VHDDLRQYATVRTWFDGLRQQSGTDPETDPTPLEKLQRFCAFVDRDPDTIVQECLRETAGGTKISMRGLRLYAQKIDEFAAQAGEARQRAAIGSTLRSFLIHNGIFLQSAPVLR